MKNKHRLIILVAIILLSLLNPAGLWAEYNNYSTVDSLAVSPNYAIDKTMFASTKYSVFKTTNGGVGWARLKNLNLLKHRQKDFNLSINLEFSPGYSTDNTIFAFIYKTNVHAWPAPVCKVIFLKSTDGGLCWKKISINKSESEFGGILTGAISPNYHNDKTLLVLNYEFNKTIEKSKFYYYKSTDGGNSWTKINLPAEYISSFYFSPQFLDDQTIFLTLTGGIYKSTDSGVTWSKIGNNSFDALTETPCLFISPNFKTDQTIFATQGITLFKSSDGGNTWTTKYERFEYQFYNLYFSPEYSTDKTIYSNRFNAISKSIDGGNTWERLLKNVKGYVAILNISPDFANDNTIFYSDNHLNLRKTTNDGKTWININNGIGRDRTKLTFKARKTKVHKGRTIVITGTLTNPSKEKLNKKTALIYEGKQLIKKLRTKKGSFRFTRLADKSAIYKAVFKGDQINSPASRAVKITVIN